MAHAAGTSARTHRLIGLLAALLLAAATALAFGRVFLGTATTMQLLGAAVAAACLAVAFERRSLLLSTVASAMGLAIAVGLIVFPESTWYGLPTADTLRAALDAAALVGEQAKIQAAPAEPIGPLLLAAVVSLWAAVFSAHALAFRAGSPLLGLIPPVALVAFADTVLEEFVKPLYGVLFLAAALLVVFADGLARVQGWGPVWSSARKGVAASAGRGARRLALTALAAAFLAPIVVPGFGSKALVDFGSPASGRVAIDPFVSVQHSLTQQTPVEVFRVTTSEPEYLRLVSLPDFDGVLWKPSIEQGSVVEAGDHVPANDEPSALTEPVVIDVTADLAQTWVPTPYPVTSVAIPGRAVRFNPDTGTTFVDHPLEKGERYTATASVVRPTADDLRNARTEAPLESGKYTYTPAGLEEVETLARRWTKGVADNDFDKAMAIQDRLRDTSEFTYTVDTPLHGGTRSIIDFLTVSKAGFCQQFSTAMAVMLRKLQIQARVVVGFATGDPLPGSRQEYSITTDSAHSWVEVYFPGWGWMPFEPTPTRANPVTTAYTTPTPACAGTTCPGNPGEAPAGGAEQSGPGVDQRDRVENDPRSTGPRGSVGGGPGNFDAPAEDGGIARIATLVGVVLAGIGFLLVPPARALRRRVRLRRAAAEPRRLILVTYEQFIERAAGLGLGRGAGETLDEYRRKVMATGYLANGHLDRLTTLATVAAYSPHDPDGEQAEDAEDAAETAIREIKRAVGTTRWLVGLYRRR
jgi:transglutaminase-like putative cysteine protease